MGKETMSRYSIGKPEPKRPIASAGYWHDEPVVLSLQTRLKIVVRPPSDFGGAGNDIDGDQFETELRQLVADALVGSAAGGYAIVGAVVEQFEDAGG